MKDQKRDVMRLVSLLAFCSVLSTPAAASESITFSDIMDNRKAVLERRGEVVQGPAKPRLNNIVKESAAYAANDVQQSREELLMMERIFEIARKAESEGNWQGAEMAYKEMLKESPSLARVKLELGLLYAKNGYAQDSKKLFEQVIESSPPPRVRQNVEKVMRQLEPALEKHVISGAVLVGMNMDGNGNSVSSSGNAIVNDVVVPLTGDSQAKDDVQGYALGTVNYVYNMDYLRGDSFKTKWYSTATAYRARQRELSTLDLDLLALKVGPQVTHAESGAEFGYRLGYSGVMLEGESYLSNVSNEITLAYPLTKQFVLNGSAAWEHRTFFDSDTNTTINERSGEAYQAKLGFKLGASKQDVITADVSYRKELTRAEWYDNEQYAASLGYIHAFDNGFVTNLSSSLKRSLYDAPDAFVSATTSREDTEGVAGLSLSKKFLGKALTGTVGYEYKRSHSNIENYKYNNHRMLSSVAYSF